MSDTPASIDAFRMTRRGRLFSPWGTEFRAPLHAPADYHFGEDLLAAIREQDRSFQACAQANSCSRDSQSTSPPDPPAVENACPTPPDRPASLSPTPQRLHLELSIQDLGDRRSAKRKREVSLCQSDSPGPSSSAFRSPSAAYSAGAAGPVRTVSSQTDMQTKEEFHQKERNKRRRRQKRQAPPPPGPRPEDSSSSSEPAIQSARAQPPPIHAPDALSIRDQPVSGRVRQSRHARPLKSSAVKHRRAAEPISTAAGDRPHLTPLGLNYAPFVGQGFTAPSRPISKDDYKAWKADDIVNLFGFDYEDWDGKSCRVLLAPDGTIIAVLVGHPNDPQWGLVTEKARQALEDMRRDFHFAPSAYSHRRGNYWSVTDGHTYGGGQPEPSNFSHSNYNRGVIQTVVENINIRRIANFASGALQVWAPRLYDSYEELLSQLRARDPDFRTCFGEGNVFAAATFNLGPNTVTHRHVDQQNVPWGMCSVTALGNYNPKRSGHIVLWSLRKVIEFPPGATILLPSATVPHSNTILTTLGETRMSITQYTAGGLFRWATCGFRSQKDFEAAGNTFDISGEQRWRLGMSLLSRWDELVD